MLVKHFVLIIIAMLSSICIVQASSNLTDVSFGKVNKFGFLSSDAKMAVVNSDGEVVRNWTSKDEYEVIALEDGEYSLIEIKDTRNTTASIKFSVKDGHVYIDDEQVDKVVIRDNYAYLFNVIDINWYLIIGIALMLLAIILGVFKGKSKDKNDTSN